MKILFIQTGGTIDKDYPKNIKGYAFEIGEPAVKRILGKLNPSFEYEILELFKKDSTEITGDDRQKLYEVCSNTDCGKIIITHGTDTMTETANFLSEIKGKTIVLTGAFRPERFSESDAAFNLGGAVGAVQCLNEGIFIAMNGIVADCKKTKRNNSDGRFIL